jgi:hypothetical protein
VRATDQQVAESTAARSAGGGKAKTAPEAGAKQVGRLKADGSAAQPAGGIKAEPPSTDVAPTIGGVKSGSVPAEPISRAKTAGDRGEAVTGAPDPAVPGKVLGVDPAATAPAPPRPMAPSRPAVPAPSRPTTPNRPLPEPPTRPAAVTAADSGTKAPINGRGDAARKSTAGGAQSSFDDAELTSPTEAKPTGPRPTPGTAGPEPKPAAVGDGSESSAVSNGSELGAAGNGSELGAGGGGSADAEAPAGGPGLVDATARVGVAGRRDYPATSRRDGAAVKEGAGKAGRAKPNGTVPEARRSNYAEEAAELLAGLSPTRKRRKATETAAADAAQHEPIKPARTARKGQQAEN